MAAKGLRLPPLPTISEIVRMYNLHARKQLSQNFILDMNMNHKIIKAAGKLNNGYVCEVGPGPGGMTRAILGAGVKKLSVIEKDRRFIPSLQMLADASEGRMDILHGDILNFNMENMFPQDEAKDWNDRPPNIHIIGNLPFNVSTPLIIKWLRTMSNKTGPWSYGRTKLTLTFQKEVAERMVAPILKNGRSRLSIMCQYLCDLHFKFTIPGKAFVPPPDVDVGVVHFIPLKNPKIDVPFEVVEKLVRSVFHYRQKMCKRGIETLFPPDRPELTREMFEKTGIEPETRSFMLVMEEFDRLCQCYLEICRREPGMFEYDYRSKENAAIWRKKSSLREQQSG